MRKLAGDYWTLLCFVPRSCEYTFFKRVTSWEIDIHLFILKWTRQQQTKAKHSYKVVNLPLEDTDRTVVIMYSNDEDYHRNTIPLLGDIPASTPVADRSSGEQAGDLSALVRRERRPKMLADIVEKNFTPTKLKIVGMEPREKFAYEGMERESNAMVETLEHFCPADDAVVFLGKGHAALIWELLKSHRHCIVMEGEGMKFEFLVEFVTKMVKSGVYFAIFVKPPPRHDEKRDLVYKVGQNIVNIWEFLFETKPQNRGARAYVTRRRKMKSLLRGYHKAPAETEVAFLDCLEIMYFDKHIGAFTIAAYATCFGEGFDAEDSEEESEDGTLQAALADERQNACSSASQKMGAPGTSSGSGGASSMAVTTDQFQRTSYMAGNTTTLSSNAVRDDSRMQAMLSPEVMASLSELAHSPATVLELLRSQTPQQPPSEPLEYEIEDIIPPDIARLPGPIVCRDDYTVMPYNVSDKAGERKGASGDERGKGSESGGGALGKGTRSSSGEHGKGSEPRGGASGKGLGPSISASGKPISHGELQKHKMCQGCQATEGKVSRPSGGAHDKGSGSSLGSGPSSGAHCRGSGSPLGLGPSGGAHGRGSRGDASGQDLGASGGASVKGVSHGELSKCVEDILPDDQVWATTVLASESVNAQVDNTGALAELEMPSLDMPAEKDEHEVSLDMKNESATAGAKETVNVQTIEEDEEHIVLSTREQHTLVQPELMVAKSEAQQSVNLVISIDESPFTSSHGAIEGHVEDKALVSYRVHDPSFQIPLATKRLTVEEKEYLDMITGSSEDNEAYGIVDYKGSWKVGKEDIMVVVDDGKWLNDEVVNLYLLAIQITNDHIKVDSACFASLLARGHFPPFAFSQANISDMRLRIAFDILSMVR
ncbi:hypothetical protein CBR_g30049 [Chara braunii]|uniref:Uncharacterized protein n=1 Tax=Chara braunii TaxID=69332 RepID=A0A388LBT3_CHABU|nr:hypothetical protein CBR_g30049 [Chara braunii]|eukprot:GBG79787.1 hypothetical protein CBR_g30049 [Chara braunii]